MEKCSISLPKNADDGFAVAVGRKLEWPLTEKFSLYGSGYYSPDSLSGGVNDYREAEGGVRWRMTGSSQMVCIWELV
ncbi:YfaZ family outer membrane protein [Lelliottia sp. SL45]|uniref:YfaZ family outer membrane protein n=1 Tax=Lelliottia sp. SL45 TaxID=2994665 RepID=UPI00227448B6|nr:YfaZ family outer membrane protein [Lelliottia sp. SL45]MCY1700866.1 YfaZ family outer membrane protein [Lelliottia sp. SL45]